jgi:hypothetical protein
MLPGRLRVSSRPSGALGSSSQHPLSTGAGLGAGPDCCFSAPDAPSQASAEVLQLVRVDGRRFGFKQRPDRLLSGD